MPSKPRKRKCRECAKLHTDLQGKKGALDLAAKECWDLRAELKRLALRGDELIDGINAMLTVLSRALEVSQNEHMLEMWQRKTETAKLELMTRERDEASRALTDFRHDVQLVMAAGADTLCGSRWINAEGLKKVLERHTEAI